MRGRDVALVSHVSTAGGHYFCSPNGCGDPVTPTGNLPTTGKPVYIRN